MKFKLLTIAMTTIFSCQPAFAMAGITKIVHAVIGEASNQPFAGQVAVACGIKSRPEGLQGVLGVKMTRIPNPLEIYMAGKANKWATPELCAIFMEGADMWCSDLKVCQKVWLGAPMVFIRKVGDHYFYRRIKAGQE